MYTKDNQLGIEKRRTKVLHSQSPISLDQLISSISCSNIDRKKLGKISLYMCQVSQKCPNTELKMHRDASRMDVDMKSGKVRVWFLNYRPHRPDVVIENAVLLRR